MFSFKLTKEEEREYYDKGYVARRGVLVIYPCEDGGRSYCEYNSEWVVYVRGKGYVRHCYVTKYAALISAESDAERMEKSGFWGYDVSQEYIDQLSPRCIAYEMCKSYFLNLQSLLKKEQAKFK